MEVRSAEEVEIDRLARIWYEGWHDAHAQIVPVELTRLRTLESFRERLQAALPNVRIVGPSGEPIGFCIVKQDELYQLFVTAQSRGSGVAAALVADAEAQLSECGVEVAWLACAIGNERAARFYEKCGWRQVGNMVNHAETSNGTFPLEVWRSEKHLSSDGRAVLNKLKGRRYRIRRLRRRCGRRESSFRRSEWLTDYVSKKVVSMASSSLPGTSNYAILGNFARSSHSSAYPQVAVKIRAYTDLCFFVTARCSSTALS